MKESLYSIKDMEVLSGIKAHTIRIWERRFQLLTPARTDTNIRFYSDDDLRRILNISFLLKHGYKISKIAEMDVTKFRDALISCGNEPKSENDFISNLTFCLINFDHQGFNRILNNTIELFGFDTALQKVIFPFMEKTGFYWQIGSIYPAQEHYISNLLRQKLIVEIDKLGSESSKEGKILFFLHETEMHEISLLYYTYLARKLGYEVLYLGQFVPIEDLRKISDRNEIGYVVTAFLNSIEKELLENYIAELHDIFQGRKIFITGYQVMEHKPSLPRNVKVISGYNDFYRYFK